MYKVFFNDSLLIIAGQDHKNPDGLPVCQLNNFSQIEKWFKEAENSTSPLNLIFQTADIQEIWKKICSLYKVIEAAGGLVKNTKSEYLLIFRRGKWDLPKGKIDKDETPEIAAIREVMEETGIEKPTIEKHLTNTYHIYNLKGTLVMKKTYWYLMSYKGNINLTPQTEEDIEKALWLNSDNINLLMSNMFGSVKDVIYSFL